MMTKSEDIITGGTVLHRKKHTKENCQPMSELALSVCRDGACMVSLCGGRRGETRLYRKGKFIYVLSTFSRSSAS